MSGGGKLRILITGASGAIGTTLRDGLAGRYDLRLCDIRPLGERRPGEEHVVADLVDPDAAKAAAQGVDAVVHLAGIPRENSWDKILPNNIAATYNVFEAAHMARAKRIVFASSNHVIGYYRADREVGTDVMPRPDSRYGVSKVFGEALGRLYADKHGLSVICLRIGSFRPAPENVRQLATWISPRDMTELVVRSIEARDVHFAVFYGVSANTRRRWRDDAAQAIGYHPRDDAEIHAARLLGQAEDTASPEQAFHGGDYCELEFSGDPGKIA
ncbi:MAG TPA: NAD(P)-dependent oxidoreductase [Alphaproteobacteria bacterium]|nr:NAD(P)-dependent oxidoreductase [Alphaproteobacteria bacterium]